MSSPDTQVIGGVGLTEVRVYEQRPAPDGKCSGCPHIHGITEEAYYVLEGAGAVELHSLDHGFRIHPLEKGQYVSFPPLVMHRLISHGGLTILAIMGNSGLPEHGDARIYFGKAVDEDPERFTACRNLPAEKGLEGALERRDLAVEGYGELLELWDTDREAYFAELCRFFDLHMAFIAKHADSFKELIQSGVLQCGERALSRLEGGADAGLPMDCFTHGREDDEALGMCGTLHPVLTLSKIGEKTE